VGNSPLHSQSSEWISETAVVDISAPAHSGQAAGHRAGKPARRKQHQFMKRTALGSPGLPLLLIKLLSSSKCKVCSFFVETKIQSLHVWASSRPKQHIKEMGRGVCLERPDFSL
jgi:hypothetical protein